MRSSGEISTGSVARPVNASATHRVGWTPRCVPSQPPTSPPIGMVPHTMNRTEAFIRPSSGRRAHPLPEAHLRDVVDDDGERPHDAADDEQRRAGGTAATAASGVSAAAGTEASDRTAGSSRASPTQRARRAGDDRADQATDRRGRQDRCPRRRCRGRARAGRRSRRPRRRSRRRSWTGRCVATIRRRNGSCTTNESPSPISVRSGRCVSGCGGVSTCRMRPTANAEVR